MRTARNRARSASMKQVRPGLGVSCHQRSPCLVRFHVDDDALAGDEPGAFEGEKAHGVAMSPGVPIRPAGTEARYAFRTPPGTSAWRSKGTNPGATVFTVIPNEASLRA